MQELCGEPHQIYLSTPFAAELDGEQWDCATNGYAVLMLRGPSEFAGKPRPAPAPPVRAIFEQEFGSRVPVSLDELRGWAYSSETTDGCQWCEQAAVLPAPGYLCGQRVNRRLVWEFLSLVHAETVEVAVAPTERGPVLIDAGAWRVVVMPMLLQPEVGEVDADDVPRFP